MATWDEIESAFGVTEHREGLLAGLRDALESLATAGCGRAYIDGSFVTSKEEPADFDACWEVAGVDPDQLDPVLLDFTHRRRAQKEQFGGELFPAEVAAEPSGTRFLDYFQRDRATGDPKGIVAIDLEELQ
jgi:hypothetical protein